MFTVSLFYVCDVYLSKILKYNFLVCGLFICVVYISVSDSYVTLVPRSTSPTKHSENMNNKKVLMNNYDDVNVHWL